MPHFSKSSADKLDDCDAHLQIILNEVIKYYDCTIVTGHRTKEVQDKKYANGESKVKWPNSKHNSMPSKAVDVAPYPIPENWGELSWKDRAKFYEFKGIVFYEAAKQGIKLRWGGDWDMDNDYKDNKFDDLIHFELV